MADDLPDLPDFDRLLDAPLPPLASPELVRARGVQRRTRSRALLLGSVLGVMALGFGSTVALTGGGDRSTLTPAAEVVASSAPSPSSSPSPSASPKRPSPSPTVSASASASASPSPSAAPSPTASASPGGGPIPAEALLAPADLGSPLWVRKASSRGPAESSLDPCRKGVPEAGSAVAHLSGSYSLVDADGPVPESPAFVQQVVRYPSPAAAQAAAEDVRASVNRCRVTQDEGQFSRGWKTVSTTPFLVQVSYASTEPGSGGSPDWYDYAGVTVAGDLVSTWILGDPHGMDRASADRTAAAVVSRLCKVSGPC